MRARVSSPEERARLWPVITRKYRNDAGYQKRTEREIPLVLLEATSWISPCPASKGDTWPEIR